MPLAVAYTNFNGRIVAENRGDVKKRYLRDTLGNMVGVMDAQQNVDTITQYWPFGEIASQYGVRDLRNPVWIRWHAGLLHRDIVSDLCEGKKLHGDVDKVAHCRSTLA